jgi:PAS domain S-box-containing protein
MQDHADWMAQPSGNYPELVTETTFVAETQNTHPQENDWLIKYPDDYPFDSIFGLFGNRSNNTVAIWDIVRGQDFILRYANPPFLRLIGKTAEEALGKSLNEIVHPVAYGKVRSGFEECVRQQHEVSFFLDQLELTLAVRVLPQMDQGRIVRLIDISVDITEYVKKRIFSEVYKNNTNQQSLLLNARLKFESLIALALRDFMDSGSKGFDGCLCNLNRELGVMMEADQAFIFQRRAEGLYIHKACWSQGHNRILAGSSHIRSIQEGRSSLPHIGRLLVINDTRSGHDLPCARELDAMGIRALLAVPICREGHVYGLLCLAQKKPRVWTTADIGMAKTAAETIMSAYLRAHLEKGLSENIRVLTEYDESLQDLLAQKETMADVSQCFLRAGAAGFAAGARTALEHIGRLLDTDGALMLFRDPDGDMEIYEWQQKGLPCRIGRSLYATALSAAQGSSEPILVDDTSEAHAPTELVKIAAGEGLRSLLVLPACLPDGRVGALVCFKAIGPKCWQRADLISAEAFTEIFLDACRLKNEIAALSH